MPQGIIIFRGEIPLTILPPVTDFPEVKNVIGEIARDIHARSPVTVFTIDAKDEASLVRAEDQLVSAAKSTEYMIFEFEDVKPVLGPTEPIAE